MANKKPVKRRVPAGRVTPKGTRPGGEQRRGQQPLHPAGAPLGQGQPHLGADPDVHLPRRSAPLVIFCNYLGLVPGDTSNVYLLVGLGLILAGIITATNYH